MLERFQEHLYEMGLSPTGHRVLVGYSGGADSTCMLHLMICAGFDLVAAHLHHGLREEADREMSLCEAFCQELDVPFVTGRADVKQISAELKVGIEEAGRKARYQFFDQAAFRMECDLIATAHTRDDQVETVLLNLTRGSGLRGLAGIPERRGKIVRPLLPFSREETRSYCLDNGFWFHDDPGNFDMTFSRSRIRLRVMPELQAINPEVAKCISRMSGLVGEEDRFLDGMAASALEQSELVLNGNLHFLTKDCELALSADKMRAVPLVLIRRALRLALGVMGGQIGADQIEHVVQGLMGGGAGSVTAEGGQVVCEWTDERLHLRQLLPDEPFRFPLTIPGETVSDSFGWQFVAHPCDPGEFKRERRSLEVVLDSAKLKGALHLRSSQEGDRMAPLGSSGSKKLSDFFQEADLTLAARRRIPIICDLIGPVWIPGIALADRVKIDGASRSAILIRLEPVPVNLRS